MSPGRRFRILVLFAFAVAALGRPMAIHAQTTELDQFVGKDLWKDHLPEDEKLRLDKIVGQETGATPWHVWTTTRIGRTRYIVLLGKPLASIPGGSSACVQLFDATAKRINSWCFQTGCRINLGSASVEFSSDLACDLIVFQMDRLINGPNVEKEYFAIGNDRLQFVRMENDKGEAVQNEYIFPDLEIGFVPDANTVEQWAGMLESTDKADVLSALVFLGGRHLCEPRRLFDEPRESKYKRLFQQLIDNPRIRELIGSLSNSDNEWIRRAALLAARGPRERLLE
jgi:hypothetical protein